MKPGGRYIFTALLALLVAGFRLQADEWVTECDVENPSGDCSIIGVFRGSSKEGTRGSFSLAIDLRSGLVAVTGTSHPVKASIRVDKHPPIRCGGLRYCLMSSADSERAINELKTGTVILMDVFTGKETFLLSMTTRGYRAGLSKVRAHRDLIR
jgi:hypothetical protein